ncbi:MAG: hypothetical protein HC869_04535 [Rhodospirillales bacterium]|nr:hypothetical protein [Rhodospirillales bacterium]
MRRTSKSVSSGDGMRGVLDRVQSDAADPLTDETSVLACRQMPIRPTTAWEQALADLSVADPKVVVDSLPRYFGQLETNRPTGLPLSDVGSVNRMSVGRYVIDAESDKIVAPQLDIDGEVEKR